MSVPAFAEQADQGERAVDSANVSGATGSYLITDGYDSLVKVTAFAKEDSSTLPLPLPQ